jgi:hypothetical protein
MKNPVRNSDGVLRLRVLGDRFKRSGDDAQRARPRGCSKKRAGEKITGSGKEGSWLLLLAAKERSAQEAQTQQG